MPIYRYYCAECLEEQELILSIAESDNTRFHTCGSRMERLPTLPAPAQFPVTGKDKAFKVLNRQDGHDLPARLHDRPRMEQAMVRGLESTKRTVGVGFKE